MSWYIDNLYLLVTLGSMTLMFVCYFFGHWGIWINKMDGVLVQKQIPVNDFVWSMLSSLVFLIHFIPLCLAKGEVFAIVINVIFIIGLWISCLLEIHGIKNEIL